jgi:hypothetical protein
MVWRAGTVVTMLWFASAITLLVSEVSATLHPESPPIPSHPEIPRGQAPRILAVLDACQAAVGPLDTLFVVGRMSEIDSLFLSYRLAYVLYPTRVVGQEIATFETPLDTNLFSAKGATLLLVLGPLPPALTSAVLVARPAPEATLLRIPAPGLGS